jgi:hypothetical protein
MKMVKSLLLGSAAGIVAIASAQAADLPVKAKAVEYVKVCSLYGAGFYYMPGTDTCLKVGGYLRVQYETGAFNGGATQITSGAGTTGSGAQNREQTLGFGYRSRADVTLDARTQTAYGTLRSYARGGWQLMDGTQNFHYDRAFIQFAGFTFGMTQSFYDFLSLAPYNYSAPRIGSDTGAAGVQVAAYTAQFGNGLSGTISLEQPRNLLVGLIDANIAVPTTTLIPTSDYSPNKAPDILANLRVDQAWGSAQIMAAAHNASAGYFGANSVINGHPSDKWGYALGAGLQLNVPGMKGDIVAVQANYAKGASGYVYQGNTTSLLGFQNGGGVGGSVGYGYVTDGVFSIATGAIEQTTAWGFTAVYQHLWSPALRTSVYGGYTAIDQTDSGSAALCAATGGVATYSNCNGDFSFWQVGTRTAWFPHPDLELGLDVMYTKLNTANEGTRTGGLALSTVNSLTSTIADQDIVQVMMRVQRNFLP